MFEVCNASDIDQVESFRTVALGNINVAGISDCPLPLRVRPLLTVQAFAFRFVHSTCPSSSYRYRVFQSDLQRSDLLFLLLCRLLMSVSIDIVVSLMDRFFICLLAVAFALKLFMDVALHPTRFGGEVVLTVLVKLPRSTNSSGVKCTHIASRWNCVHNLFLCRYGFSYLDLPSTLNNGV